MEQDEQQRAGDVYREIKVGAILRTQRGRERSELAADAWVDTPVEGSLHYVAQRSAWGDFGRRLYALALEGGLPYARQVVALGDGAPWLWQLVEEPFAGAVHIVDVWHAQQHVWEVAHAVFGRTTPQGVAWAKQGCPWLIHGAIETLLQSIAALPTVAPPSGQRKRIPEQALGYSERLRGKKIGLVCSGSNSSLAHLEQALAAVRAGTRASSSH